VWYLRRLIKEFSFNINFLAIAAGKRTEACSEEMEVSLESKEKISYHVCQFD